MEKPILFSGEMVRAILDRRKTVTRRVMKPQPKPDERFGGGWLWFKNTNGPATQAEAGFDTVEGFRWAMIKHCPYGRPGDCLWVRETWACDEDGLGDIRYVSYRADGSGIRPMIRDFDTGKRYELPWRPSIFMPRWASRLTLGVTAVRVERLQDITEEDAIAEGVNAFECLDCDALIFKHQNDEPHYYNRQNDDIDPIELFVDLWNSINGHPKPVYQKVDGRRVVTHYVAYPWEEGTYTTTHQGKPFYVYGNPWVWVVGFELANKDGE